MTDVADKLREARALVAKGWCRGNYHQRRGYCTYGALQQAFNGDAEDCSVSEAFHHATKLLQKAADTHTLISWNDSQKSKRPVLAAFDKAIELAESSQ